MKSAKLQKAPKKAKVKIPNQEPQEVVQPLNLKEIQEKIDFYWNEIGKESGWDLYIENWKQYDYYTDLKTKYLKK